MSGKIFLPVIAVGILRANTIEQNIVLKQLEGYTKISGSSAATRFGVKFHLVLQSW